MVTAQILANAPALIDNAVFSMASLFVSPSDFLDSISSSYCSVFQKKLHHLKLKISYKRSIFC